MLVAVCRRAGSLSVPVVVVATERVVLRPLEAAGVSSVLVLRPSLPESFAAIRHSVPVAAVTLGEPHEQ